MLNNKVNLVFPHLLLLLAGDSASDWGDQILLDIFIATLHIFSQGFVYYIPQDYIYIA